MSAPAPNETEPPGVFVVSETNRCENPSVMCPWMSENLSPAVAGRGARMPARQATSRHPAGATSHPFTATRLMRPSEPALRASATLHPTPEPGQSAGLLIESDLDAVAVHDPVVAPFEPRPVALLGLRLAARLQQPVAGRHLGADESLGEIAVDGARRVQRAVPVVERPGAHLVRAHGEERDDPEQPVAGADHEREAVLSDPELPVERIPLCVRKPHHFA